MSCNCRKCREQREEVITDPTRTVVNTRTNRRVVKHIHPTEVINVNRTVVRNEHYYPVCERDVYETVEENVDCGSNWNNNRCRPFWNR
ncbi:CotD family spore coat protein [Peribacillus muralis]|uniref:CotD family spore coat protein n=1 Tax=Peribacillus muralis TaxID=264697 RepID=UPI003CFC5FC8